jgi:hypothetical protein
MTGFNRKIPATVAARRFAPRQFSYVAGKSATVPVQSSCVVLCVTSRGAALLLSKGSRRLASNCNSSSVNRESRGLFDPHRMVAGDPIPIRFDQLMESIYD